MKRVSKVLLGVLLSVSAADLALAQSRGRPDEGRGSDHRGDDRRGQPDNGRGHDNGRGDGHGQRDRINRMQVIRVAQSLAFEIDEVERIVVRESTYYRQGDRRVQQILAQLSQTANQLARVAVMTGATAERQMEMLLDQIEFLEMRANMALYRANFSRRVDRQWDDVNDKIDQLDDELKDLRPGRGGQRRDKRKGPGGRDYGKGNGGRGRP